MDSTLIIVAGIAALPPTLVALLSLRKATETHLLVNSRMTELLTTVRAQATAEGQVQGAKEANARTDDLKNN